MSTSHLVTRTAIVFLFVTMATATVALTFVPMAHGQNCGSLAAEVCAAAFGTPDNSSSPRPTPTPPPRNYAAEHAAAYAQAIDSLESQYATPDWRVWPSPDANQIVHLWSFFAITDAGWEPLVAHGSSGPNPPTRVTITATPTRSVWNLAELGTGATHEVLCEDQGTPWEPGLTARDSTCGWEFEHTSDVIGEVELTVQIEHELVWTSTAPGFGPGDGAYVSEPSTPETLTVSEVQTFGRSDTASGREHATSITAGEGNINQGQQASDTASNGGVDGSTHDPSNSTSSRNDASNGGSSHDDGSVDGDNSLPVRTLTCVARIQAGGDFLFGGDAASGYRYILQEFADGTRILTVARDGGAAGGVGGTVGARIYVGDASVGALAKAEAKAWQVLSNGEVYDLAPGDDLNELLVQLAIREIANTTADGLIHLITPPGANEAAGFISSVTGGHIDLIPEVPDFAFVTRSPDSHYTEISTIGSTGATAQAGLGILVGTASVTTEAGVASRRHELDSGYSLTTTFSGSFEADLTLAEHDLGQTSGVVAEVEGSISVETIYDVDGDPIEVIYTRTYSADTDAGTDLGEPGDDARSVTTQQWRFDLTVPTVAAAIKQVDKSYPAVPVSPVGPAIDTGPFAFLFGDIADSHGTTSGPVVQNINSTVVPFGVEAGLGVNAEVSGEAGCVEVS